MDPRLTFWSYPSHAALTRPEIADERRLDDPLVCHHVRRVDPERTWQSGSPARGTPVEDALRRALGWFRAVAVGMVARPSR